MSRARLERLVGCGLVLLTGLVFLPALTAEFVNFDDDLYIQNNPHVTGGLSWANLSWACTTTYCVNWHPLTWVTFQAEYTAYGEKACGYHFTNVLLHAANAGLLLWVLQCMTKAFWPSTVVAALFALHPLHVESVAWVSERKDVLSTFFGLVALAAYLRYCERPGLLRYLLTTLAFALSLMAKPMLVTLPVVLLLLDYWPLGHVRSFSPEPSAPANVYGLNLPTVAAGSGLNESNPPVTIAKLVVEKVPWLILALASSLMTLRAQNPGGLSSLHEVSDRIGKAAVFYASYIEMMVWPHHLAVFYPDPETLPVGRVVWSILLLGVVSLLALATARRQPYLLVGWLWYLVTMLPVIGLVKVIGGQGLADRYTYVPLIGLFLVLTWGGCELNTRWHWPARAQLAIAGIVLGLCLVLTLKQISYWQNSQTLWEHSLEAIGENYMAHDGLGAVALKEGRWQEAAEHFEKTLAIKSDDVEAHLNLATALKNLGYGEEALSHCRTGLELYPVARAHYQLAEILESLGRLDEAFPHYREAFRLDPPLTRRLDARINEGLQLRRQGHLAEAEKRYRAVLAIDPNHAAAHANLGAALGLQGKYDQAVEQFTVAVRLDPGDEESRRNLDLALRLRDQQRQQSHP
jgi:Flp pilus assembly protein TadD